MDDKKFEITWLEERANSIKRSDNETITQEERAIWVINEIQNLIKSLDVQQIARDIVELASCKAELKGFKERQ